MDEYKPTSQKYLEYRKKIGLLLRNKELANHLETIMIKTAQMYNVDAKTNDFMIALTYNLVAAILLIIRDQDRKKNTNKDTGHVDPVGPRIYVENVQDIIDSYEDMETDFA